MKKIKSVIGCICFFIAAILMLIVAVGTGGIFQYISSVFFFVAAVMQLRVCIKSR